MVGPNPDERRILVLNAGSSSLKFAIFGDGFEQVVSGSVSEIGPNARLKIGDRKLPIDCRSHKEALEKSFAALADASVPMETIFAVGHRVVHGGETLTRPALATEAVIAGIKACEHLAPLHNPHNLTGVRAISALLPGLPQVVCFDTAFHAGNPAVATTYALPPEQRSGGVRRFGFHGLSYSTLVGMLPELSGEALPRRLLALHLGNGASACAILDGRSVATTMGFSPLSGLTMGTRSGDIDGVAVLRLAEKFGVKGAESLLLDRSGLLGLVGTSDMAEVLALGTNEAEFAVAHFCYWAARHAGSLIAAMGGLDAIAFTGGIGEHAAEIRRRIADHLAWAGVAVAPDANQANAPRVHAENSAIGVWIVPANEEREIARQTAAVLSA